MAATVRHRSSGDDVTIELLDGGDRIGSLVVSASEAKRFAWALLNDLDPDEADACGAPVQYERRRRKKEGVADRILASLLKGARTGGAIAEEIGEHSGVIASRAVGLRQRGYIKRIDPNARVAIYDLTDLGRERVEARA